MSIDRALPAADAGTETCLAETPAPAYVDTTDTTAIRRRPVVPEPLQRGNLRGTVGQQAGLRWHQARYHSFRSPGYVVVYLWHALRGTIVLAGKLTMWLHWPHGWILESQAVARGTAGHHDAVNVHKLRSKTQASRGKVVIAAAGAVLVAVLVMVRFFPWWAWALTAAAVVLVLARHGRPDGKRVVRPAVVAPQYQPPTPEIIARALGSLGISAINEVLRDGRGLNFVTDVHRDGDGWGAELDLPHGVTAGMILQRRPQLSAGLRRPLSATWPEGVPHEHEGRLRLWIGFQDMSKVKPKPWPLLRAGQADIFAAIPFGTDPRGREVGAPLFAVNWLIGAAPGNGKTSAVRVLACGAALDPVCDLWVHELAGKGDLEPLAQVSHRYTSGLDDESVGYTAESVRLLRAELERRSARLKEVPREQRPDGSVTRELAGRRGLRLRPIVCVIDEVQNLTMHPVYGAEAAADIAYVLRLGRAYGVIFILATQRPSAETVPTAISGNMTMRMCLKVPGQPENDAILGTGSYRAGYDAAAFRGKTDAGLGWLRSDADPQVVRTFYLDLPDSQRIAQRARVIRDSAGVLTGYALGEDDGQLPRSFAADVLAVFGADAKLHTATIARRLAGSLPGVYPAITAAAVGSQLRGLGVTVKNVREPGSAPAPGCERAAVEAVTSP